MEVSLNEIVEFSNVSSEQGVIPVTVDKICKLPIQEIFQLHAERVSRCEYPFYKQIACEWMKVVDEKCADDPWRNISIFSGCAFITKCIAKELSDSEMEGDLYVCKDDEGNTQAMMILIREIHAIYIEYLVTNPINIRCAVNDHEPKRVKGAGTCLVEMAVEIAMEENKAFVDVCPLDSAIPFYEKCGFVPDIRGGMTILLPHIDDRTHPFIVA